MRKPDQSKETQSSGAAVMLEKKESAERAKAFVMRKPRGISSVAAVTSSLNV